ncbi:hypothetical protein KI809_02405 [Geobacter pelophilus]|uniref:Uncharacterized protein n=1 Tax=Geoanaerobacter pelophilus TaxID=60036 RepID=A0AAW4L4H3_9BACT|nr:hypothetical protein [Geoanaerobacter pelophilus]
MSKDSNSSPDVMPVPQSNEIHPRGLLEAISYIDQNFANELGGCIIKARFLTTKQRLEFMEVGFRSSFASGIVSALLTPVAIGVIEQYIPMFGDSSPTFFDKFSAFLLALGFSLGYAIFMAKASTCFIGEYTRAMVLNLLGGMVFGAIVKAVLAFIAFHFLYFKIFTDKNVLWAVGKLYYAKTSPSTVASIYYWVQGFKGIFLISAYFVLVSTAVFIIIPIVAMLVAWQRNRKLIAAGVVHVDTDNF